MKGARFVILESVSGGRPWNRTRRASPRGSYSPLPHLAACRPLSGVITLRDLRRQQEILLYLNLLHRIVRLRENAGGLSNEKTQMGDRKRAGEADCGG